MHHKRLVEWASLGIFLTPADISVSPSYAFVRLRLLLGRRIELHWLRCARSPPAKGTDDRRVVVHCQMMDVSNSTRWIESGGEVDPKVTHDSSDIMDEGSIFALAFQRESQSISDV